MNYRKIYDALIHKRKFVSILNRNEDYCELHHIVPRCLGGSDKKANLVLLTAREHFIAHLLIYHFVTNEKGVESIEHYKMLRALQRMFYDHRHQTFTSKKYEIYRREVRRIMANQTPWNKGKVGIYSEEYRRKISEHHKDVSGKNNPCYGKKGKDHPSFGRLVSQEVRSKISRVQKGKKLSEEQKKIISLRNSGSKNGMYGKKFREVIGEEKFQKWREGQSIRMKGKYVGDKNPCFGKRWVHNTTTGEIIYINKEDLQSYISKGYKQGTGIQRGGIKKGTKK